MTQIALEQCVKRLSLASQYTCLAFGIELESVFLCKGGVELACVEGSEAGSANTVLDTLLRPPGTANLCSKPTHSFLHELSFKIRRTNITFFIVTIQIGLS